MLTRAAWLCSLLMGLVICCASRPHEHCLGWTLPGYPVSKPSKQDLMYFLWEEEEFGKKDQNTSKYTEQSISKDRWEKFCVTIQVEQEGTGCKSEWVRQFLPVLFGHSPLFRIPIIRLSSSWCRFHICLEYHIESHVLIWGAGMTVLP